MATKFRLMLFGISAYCGLTWTVLFVLYAESLSKLMCGVYSCDNPLNMQERMLLESGVADMNGYYKYRARHRHSDTLSNQGNDQDIHGALASNVLEADIGALRKLENKNDASATGGAPRSNPRNSADAEKRIDFNELFVNNNMFINDSVTNQNSFKYVRSNSDLCKRRQLKDDVFLLLTILTAPNEIRRRISIRKTWANVTYVAGMRVETIFLVGNSADESINKIMAKEDELFHDMCWNDYTDHYQNLTLKTITGFRWTNSFCDKAKYVLKIDSDTVPNLRNIVEHLKTSKNENFLFEGKLFQNKTPVRDTSDRWTKKWYVSEDQYPYPTYPPYLNGPSYLLSSYLLKPLLSVSVHVPYIPIEDVYVAILMKTIGVKPVSNNLFTQRYMMLDHPNETLEYESFCLFSDVFTVYSFDPPESLYTFWNKWIYFDNENCPGLPSTIPYL